MLALVFTNSVFLAYALYLALERKSNVYKSKLFWMVLIALLVSLYLTCRFLPVEIPIEHTLLP